MLNIENLTKQYGKQTVLDHVNLEIKEPSIIGLVGINGSGKTTLMKCLCGLIIDYSGSISKSESVTYAIDYPSFYQNVTAIDNLRICDTLNTKKSPYSVEDVLHMVGLYEDRNKKFKKLSKGMQQKLAIARCLLSNSKIVLLDEPFSGLDFLMKEDLKRIIQNIHKQGKTVIISSHILEELGEVSNIIWYLKNGSIKAELKLAETSRRYTLHVLKHEGIEQLLQPYHFQCIKEEGDELYYVITIEHDCIVSFLNTCIQNNVQVLEYYDSTNKIKDTLHQMEREG